MHGRVITAPCLLMGKQAVENHTPWLGIKQIKVCVCVSVSVSVSVRVRACVCVSLNAIVHLVKLCH